MTEYQHYFFDVDGVLLEDNRVIPHAVEALNHLVQTGKSVYYYTNNATKSRASMVQSMSALGFPINLGSVVCCGYAAAVHANSTLPQNSKVMIIGMGGLLDEFSAFGFEITDVSSLIDRKIQGTEDFSNLETNGEVAVYAGFCNFFNYYSLCYASKIIQTGGQFVATNKDKVNRSGGYLTPGNGCLIGMLEKATGEKAYDIGKPNPLMLNQIVERDGIDKSTVLVIGDKLETDIQSAINCQVASALVLTGVETRETIKDAQITPTYIWEDLQALLN